MKRFTFLLLLITLPVCLFSQVFNNIKFTPPTSGSTITITYDITSSNLQQTFYIKVYCSTDGGATFKPEALKYVTGDVGKVAAGMNKKIVWDAGKEYKNLVKVIQFKLLAEVLHNKKVEISNGTNTNSFTDPRDGRNYKIVKIGEQVWMAENMAYQAGNDYWVYEDKERNLNTYGCFYTWEAAQKVCPPGWRLPSKDDFKKLVFNYDGGLTKTYNALIKGGSSGFDVLLAGAKNEQKYWGMNVLGYLWSSTSQSDSDGYFLYISSKAQNAYTSSLNKNRWFSVRCIKQ